MLTIAKNLKSGMTVSVFGKDGIILSNEPTKLGMTKITILTNTATGIRRDSQVVANIAPFHVTI